jgi:cyclohexa-1,5-dienecarbonyl-CoA hydratase
MLNQIQPAFSRITLSIQSPGAQITLNHPPVNVIDLTMMEELLAALRLVEERSDLSTLALAGDGVDFSAGVDIRAHAPEQVREMLAGFHSVIRALANTRKVTLAAVHGNCLGGGAELALMCDMLFCTENARFQFPEISLACFPPVAAVALAAAVGQKRAAELVLTGNMIHGDEALHMGLANDAVADEQELQELVQEVTTRLASLSPAALALAKKALYSWDAIHFDKGLARAEQIYLNELMATEDAREGVRAWLEKRPPRWKGR